MLCKCLKYSSRYPTGSQYPGDIIELTAKHARYFEGAGWVKILSKSQQRKKRTKISYEDGSARDLSQKFWHNKR